MLLYITVLEADIEPVRCGIARPVGLHALHILENLVIVVRYGTGTDTGINLGQIAQPHIEYRICNHIRKIGSPLYTVLTFVFDTGTPFRALLRGHENHTVSRFQSVNSGRYIFQHRNRLDRGRINFREIIFHAIQQHQRCASCRVQRVDATDRNRSIVTTRLRTTLVDPDTRRVIEHLRRIGDRLVLFALDIHGGHRSGEGEFFHSTVTHDNQFLQFGGLVFQHHVDLRTVIDRFRDTLVTDITERKPRIGSDQQRIGAVGASSRTVRTAHNDGNADKRLSLSVTDGARHPVFPGNRRRSGAGIGFAAQKDPVGALHPVLDTGTG